MPEGLLAGFRGASFANRFDEVILPANLRSFRTPRGDELPRPPSQKYLRPMESNRFDLITHALSAGPPRVRAADGLRPAATAHSRIEDAIHAIR